MAFSIGEFTKWLKLPTKYFFALSVATGFLLFGDSAVVGKMGLTVTLDSFREYIGAVFVLSSAILGTNVSLSIWKSFQIIFLRIGAKRYLRRLTPDEKELLARFIVDNSKTRNLSITDGIAIHLETIGIIYQSSNIGRLHSFPYTMHSWAWSFLHHHPELISTNADHLALIRESFRRRRG